VRVRGVVGHSRRVSVFAVLVVVGPLLLLATTVVELWARGPLGWLASVLLVAAVAWACWWLGRVTLRWWHSTKAPVRPSRSAPTPRHS
jgi:hypothetical protein